MNSNWAARLADNTCVEWNEKWCWKMFLSSHYYKKCWRCWHGVDWRRYGDAYVTLSDCAEVNNNSPSWMDSTVTRHHQRAPLLHGRPTSAPADDVTADSHPRMQRDLTSASAAAQVNQSAFLRHFRSSRKAVCYEKIFSCNLTELRIIIYKNQNVILLHCVMRFTGGTGWYFVISI